jgi:hypothetical protein
VKPGWAGVSDLVKYFVEELEQGRAILYDPAGAYQGGPAPLRWATQAFQKRCQTGIRGTSWTWSKDAPESGPDKPLQIELDRPISHKNRGMSL